jgi:hypothetical protein
VEGSRREIPAVACPESHTYPLPRGRILVADPDLLSGGIPEEAHERTERGQGFVHHRGARHHESADNDHGGVSEANDSCWQQNPAEVQQNSSKWGQRIGWTVSKSTRVRWGTEFVHPTGLGMTPGSTLIPGAVTVTVMSWEAPSHPRQ